MINLAGKNRKDISVKEETWAELKEMGDVTDSFNDVIQKLMKFYKNKGGE